MNERIVTLLYKVVKGEYVNRAEKEELDEWIESSPYNKAVYDEVTNPQLLEKEIKTLSSYNKKATWKKVKAGMMPRHSQSKLVSFFRSQYGRYAAAIAFLIVLAGSYFFFIKPFNNVTADVSKNLQEHDIAPPSGDKAVLVLADGSQIPLDDAANGTLVQQGNMRVIKQDGLVSYIGSGSSQSGKVPYNKIITPRGGQHRLQLPDGSRVWLNAESSIRYPAWFTGKERVVMVEGEAYFEIAKNTKQPFKVHARDVVVEVLGTHFNINAYIDEAVLKTTLLEGKVRIATLSSDRLKTTNQKLLVPGQAASVSPAGVIAVKETDIEQAVSWKNNSFYFRDDDIETIARQLARWYDVKIVYEGGKISKKYTGIISRNVKVSEIFKFLEISGGVHARVENGKIIITPNNP